MVFLHQTHWQTMVKTLLCEPPSLPSALFPFIPSETTLTLRVPWQPRNSISARAVAALLQAGLAMLLMAKLRCSPSTAGTATCLPPTTAASRHPSSPFHRWESMPPNLGAPLGQAHQKYVSAPYIPHPKSRSCTPHSHRLCLSLDNVKRNKVWLTHKQG